ncbi:MAG: hypothetical protein RRY29_02515 [Desulfovibrionaceae bacterium]
MGGLAIAPLSPLVYRNANTVGTPPPPKDAQPFAPATVTVLLQPQEKTLVLKRPKTARQLLAALDLREETALVAREGELLTPDRRIYTGDTLLVRKVVSSG